ncbi:MAG: hypothetical protein DRI89_06420 [Bacteroidetes bacterium]|nr:MAG: hypothetical protein DRI89_06420 [Bacteroidota bacterium]
MKNIFTLVLLLSIISFGMAQTLPNNDFEIWESGGTYEEPEFWHTPNPFTAIAGAVGVTKTEDAYSGTYAARLETIDLLGGSIQAPGLLTLSDFNVDIGSGDFSFSGGYFLQENVSRLTGMYKYAGVNGDSASIVIYNFKHPEGEEIDTIGIGVTFLHDTEDWTPFEVIMENNNNHLPDTFNVMVLSSGSTDLNIGSVLFVDSISIETNTGIIDLWNPLASLHVYPNPAGEMVNFEANDMASDRVLTIYDLNGRMLSKSDFNDKAIQVDTKVFKTGILSYQVTEKGKRVYSGSFLKK